jgi:hypothetical protein
MSEQKPRSQMIPANYSDKDAAMAKWIILGFIVIAGGLIALMAFGSMLAGKA